MPEGLGVLEAAALRFGIALAFTEFDWNCSTYDSTGRIMPEDGLDLLAGFDAIYLGAVGMPNVPDHVSLWDMLIPIRRRFHQYVNLRPVKLFEGVRSPLADRGPDDIDMMIVRENVEGEYSQIGGRLYPGTEDELAIQQARFHQARLRPDHALRLRARRHPPGQEGDLGHQVERQSSTRCLIGDERFAAIAAEYPGIGTDRYHIDILTAHFVAHPDWFDVVVGSNLFGDILSDLGPAVAGSIGLAASGNINPGKDHPSMFEPVHGSAPDIAGRGIANPIAQIWSGAMMLEHLGHPGAAQVIVDAIAALLAGDGPRTADLGGTATTREVGGALASVL